MELSAEQLKQGIVGLVEPQRSIANILIDFYDNMRILESRHSSAQITQGMQSVSVLMALNDIIDVINKSKVG